MGQAADALVQAFGNGLAHLPRLDLATAVPSGTWGS